MENSLKDLEVLQKYLSEEELKEIAKQVAYDAFKDSIGSGNPYSKDNIQYYIKYGAYEAVVKHAKENQLENISELSKDLSAKVAKIINNLQSYNIPYEDMVKEALEAHRETVIRKVEEVIKDACQDDGKYYQISSQVKDTIGEWIGDRLMVYLKESFKDEQI